MYCAITSRDRQKQMHVLLRYLPLQYFHLVLRTDVPHQIPSPRPTSPVSTALRYFDQNSIYTWISNNAARPCTGRCPPGDVICGVDKLPISSGLFAGDNNVTNFACFQTCAFQHTGAPFRRESLGRYDSCENASIECVQPNRSSMFLSRVKDRHRLAIHSM